MNNTCLDIRSLNFTTGKFQLCNINLCCRKGEYHILLGPTGSGKSTLIKCVLGIFRPEGGVIFFNNRDITREPPERRSLGYLPQNYALFPHLNVEENIRFGLRARKLPSSQEDQLVSQLFRILNIENLRKRSVRHLSGGERQKVALGRALAPRPEIILLDEPFSSIDEGARRLLWFDLKRVIRQVGITAIHITHHLEEAYTLGEKFSVLINGELVQSGSKEDIFERPASESVAKYLNYRNIFSGWTENHPEGARVNLGHFSVVVKGEISPGEKIKLCIRPQDLKIIREDVPIRDPLQQNVFSGEIISLFMLPEHCVMHFKIDGSPQQYDLELKFPAYIKQRHNLYIRKKVKVAIWEPNIIIFKG